jgi:hypothetical protein
MLLAPYLALVGRIALGAAGAALTIGSWIVAYHDGPFVSVVTSMLGGGLLGIALWVWRGRP